MILLAPATLDDLAELREAYHPHLWKALVVQIPRSDAVTLRDKATGRLLAIAGVYREDGEVWLQVTPALGQGPENVRLVRTLLRLARLIKLPLTAHVKEGHAPGARMLAMAGFTPGAAMMGGLLRQWTRNP